MFFSVNIVISNEDGIAEKPFFQICCYFNLIKIFEATFYLDSSNDHLVKTFVIWIYKKEVFQDYNPSQNILSLCYLFHSFPSQVKQK